MRELCRKACKLYDASRKVNNCKKFNTTVRDDDTVCCYIQFNHK